MLLLSALLMLLGLACEGVALYALLLRDGVSAPLLFIVFHALAALLIGAIAATLAPPRYGQRRGVAISCFTLMVLCVPLFGALGLLLAVLPGLHLFRPQRPPDWEQRGEPELPFKPAEANPESLFMRFGLSTVVKHFDDQSLRERAVMATRHLGTRRAIPILRAALSDGADEVRLLAYSMLGGKERTFELEVQRLQRALRRTPHGNQDWIEEQIASLYWEQANLGLVEGEVRAFVLRQAREHLESAMRFERSAERLLLYGKIALQLDERELADAAFIESASLGMDTNRVAPYMAELAYLRGDFDDVQRKLGVGGAVMLALPRLEPVVRYWKPQQAIEQ